MKSSANSNQRIADRMLAEGKLTVDSHATAVSFVGLHGGRIEDALIENQLVAELDLLRYVATVHGTRFVSTEKLYRAAVDQNLIGLIPRKLAETHCVYPVLYDADTRVLSVVTPDPDNLAALTDVKVAAGVRQVAALVSRPAAVQAAISRAYRNDPALFAQIFRPANQLSLSIDRFSGGASTGPNPAAQPAFSGRETGPNPMGRHSAAPEPAPSAHQVSRSTPPPAMARVTSTSPRPMVSEAPVAEYPPVALTTDFVETLNVLVSLLENARPDLRGHSAACGRIAKRLCDRMGLAPAHTAAAVVAAYLHDLGKAGTYHLTALNVAEYEGHRAAAQKVWNVPERLLAAVALAPDTKAALGAMYERVDGKGMPNGLSGKEIPLAARILAAVDAYADLTQNPRNPSRRILKPAEAVAFLAKHRGTVFDPTVLDLLKAEVAGEDLRAKLLADRAAALIVDTDPEETTVLELRLVESGFDVFIARTMQQALHELRNREITIVISEVDLDQPDAGLTLKSAVANEPFADRILVWVIHTAKTDRQLAEIVFELGVDDMVSKPTPPDVFVAKLRQLAERKRARLKAPTSRGVSGSLAEMGLPDVVQILWHGRKSCTVRLNTEAGKGDIGFVEGQIVDARVGSLRGEEAFYRMLTAKTGDFNIDPETSPRERTIDVSPEGLLLEGMRRLDEGIA